jgi:CRP-like cAMP-binding protein
MAKATGKREQRLRKSKSQLIDELEALERRVKPRAQIIEEINALKKQNTELNKISFVPPEKVQFKKNQTIYNEGDEGDSVYIILRGQVEFRRDVKGKKTIRKLATIGEGIMFGDLALFDNRPRMATAIALKKTVAYRLTREEYQGQISKIDPAARFIVENLVLRLRKMADELIKKK